jgi:3-isopropylmalate/(R)-2-methylmalate dehydratase small subunit
MEPIKTLQSKVVPLVRNDVDTDQIIPARYLKVTDKKGLGDVLFADWRFDSDGSPKPDFELNQDRYKGRSILLAGDNFGCGSSREHAPWALVDYGFRAVVARSFADIFKNNALKNGLLPIALDAASHAVVVSAGDDADVAIDLESCSVTLPGGATASFEVDPFARKCLLAGTDQLGYLSSFGDKIAAYEAGRGW